MTTIGNDHELRMALDGLTPSQQRLLGGKFVKNVLGLCDDTLVQRAVAVAIDPDAPEAARDDAFRSAKAIAVKTYTDCGKDTDWMSQAAHFVAAAAAACLTPPSQQGDSSAAWKAAMQARMARNCEMIERQDGDTHNEAETQYRIATELVS